VTSRGRMRSLAAADGLLPLHGVERFRYRNRFQELIGRS
jgi:hypothetical protein